MDSSTIYNAVQEHYSSCAAGETDEHANNVAKAFGYSEEELQSIPKDANLGLSCGNPVAIASLRDGETVVDLGSGAGLDVFLSASKVGPTGHAIGVDRNNEMLAKANANMRKARIENVDFVESPITKIALPDGVADCVISNCVINLVPQVEKHLVFEEIFRILKPGGRVAISDILARKPLPEALRMDVAQYVGCIAGASLVEEYRTFLREAGFCTFRIVSTGSDLNIYTQALEEDSFEKAKSSCRNTQAFCGCTTNCYSNANDPIKSLEHEKLDINEWAGTLLPLSASVVSLLTFTYKALTKCLR